MAVQMKANINKHSKLLARGGPAMLAASCLFLLLLCCANPIQGADSSSAKPATNYPDFQSALKGQMHVVVSEPEPVPSSKANNQQALVLSVIIILSGIVTFRVFSARFGNLLTARFNPWLPLAAASANHTANILAEEQRFSAFVENFQL